MGEVAEDMLDGTCCQYCGVWHDDILAEAKSTETDGNFTPQGFPWTCKDCKEDSDG